MPDKSSEHPSSHSQQDMTYLSPAQIHALAHEILRISHPHPVAPSNIHDNSINHPEPAGTLTRMQVISNHEIHIARHKIGQLPPKELVANLHPLHRDGQPNPDYDAGLRARLILALTRLQGDDPTWDAYWPAPAAKESHHD